MARFIHWKEKVAALDVLLSSTIFLLTFINIHGAIAQTSANSQASTHLVTYSCSATRLESVIEFLSKNSGYDFIYSRDLVDISRPVSLAVKNKSIDEILVLIEQQANVSFMLKDRHIIVKGNLKPATVVAQASARSRVHKVTPPSFESSDSLLITSVSKINPLRPRESHAELLQDHLDRRINELQALLGPGVPRNIPPFYINQVNFNNRHKGWFASIGTFVGDNSSGIELQAGLPYLYAVFHPRWTLEDGFSGVYGVGNSFNLTGNFSFNTIYMYSGRTKAESLFPFSPPGMQFGPEFRSTETVRHHQVKVAVQYAFSKTLSLRVGPVFNYRSITRELAEMPTNIYQEANYIYRQGDTYSNASVTYQSGQPVSPSRTIRTFESWIGWDASLIYRINFFPRR